MAIDEKAFAPILERLVDPWHKTFARDVVESYEANRNKPPLKKIQERVHSEMQGNIENNLFTTQNSLPQKHWTGLHTSIGTNPYCNHTSLAFDNRDCPDCVKHYREQRAKTSEA